MNDFENLAYGEGYTVIAGVDEAGRGPLAGPVVAAAVVLPRDYHHPDINDSKQLSPARRSALHDVIRSAAVAVGLGVVEPDVIDALNILQATRLAMREAVLDLDCAVDFLLVDGNCPIRIETPQKTIVKGDALSISIAAASIVAKVSRDRIMEIYHRQYPQYNFLRNKGYGTAEHRRAITAFGLSKIHRKSFHLKEREAGKTTRQTTFTW